MEIRKIIFLFILITNFVACKQSKGKIESNIEQHEKQKEYGYAQKPYLSKKLNNSIYIFDFGDSKNTIEYTNVTFFGKTTGQEHKIYKLNDDLDLGEIDLLRFDGLGSNVYLLALEDYSFTSYHVLFEKNDSLFDLGKIDIDLSKLIEEQEKNNIQFKIEKINNEIIVAALLNNTDFLKKQFTIQQKPMNTFEIFSNISQYTDINANNASISSLENNKEDFFQITKLDELGIEVSILNSNKVYKNFTILEGISICPDVSLDKIVQKSNFFTIEKYNCDDKNYFKEYITFKFDNELLLYKYSIEYTNRQNPDAIIPNKNFIEKKIGKVNFEDVDPEFLLKLRQNP